jgi:hypothetical protein
MLAFLASLLLTYVVLPFLGTLVFVKWPNNREMLKQQLNFNRILLSLLQDHPVKLSGIPLNETERQRVLDHSSPRDLMDTSTEVQMVELDYNGLMNFVKDQVSGDGTWIRPGRHLRIAVSAARGMLRAVKTIESSLSTKERKQLSEVLDGEQALIGPAGSSRKNSSCKCEACGANLAFSIGTVRPKEGVPYDYTTYWCPYCLLTGGTTTRDWPVLVGFPPPPDEPHITHAHPHHPPHIPHPPHNFLH